MCNRSIIIYHFAHVALILILLGIIVSPLTAGLAKESTMRALISAIIQTIMLIMPIISIYLSYTMAGASPGNCFLSRAECVYLLTVIRSVVVSGTHITACVASWYYYNQSEYGYYNLTLITTCFSSFINLIGTIVILSTMYSAFHNKYAPKQYIYTEI
jgi:hypothetical protein